MEKYEIIDKIGAGSYGAVFTVRRKDDTKSKFVLKKIDLNRSSQKERESADQECELLRTLKHPNIVSFKDSFWCSRDVLGIVMSFCEGGDLYHILKERKKSAPLSESQVMQWFIQITLAVQYLHTKKILHRDLKTQNVFLTKSQMVKVGDLGIARQLADGELAQTLIGTPYYMSPEIFQNIPYNYKSDIWSLGCILYEMTSLKHAFTAHDFSALVHKIINGALPTLPKNYSPDVQNLIREMLNSDPKKRPDAGTILKKQFIQKNIKSFLDASKRPASGRRKTSTSSTSSSVSTSSTSSGRPSSSNRRHVRKPSRDEPDSRPGLVENGGGGGGRRKRSGSSESSEQQDTLKPIPPIPEVADVSEKYKDEMNFGQPPPPVLPSKKISNPSKELEVPTEEFTLTPNQPPRISKTPQALPEKPRLHKKSSSDNRGRVPQVRVEREEQKSLSLQKEELLNALKKPAPQVNPVKKQQPVASERVPSATKKTEASKLSRMDRPVSASAEVHQSKARLRRLNQKKSEESQHNILKRLSSDEGAIRPLDLAQPSRPLPERPSSGVRFTVENSKPSRESSASSNDSEDQATVKLNLDNQDAQFSLAHERRPAEPQKPKVSPRDAARQAARRASDSASIYEDDFEDDDNDDTSSRKVEFDDYVAILTTTLKGDILGLSADFADMNISAGTINPQLPIDTMSARPKDRAKAVRRDLEQVFTPVTINRCLDIMASDNDETEDELRDVMGDEFDNYIGQLWHLKLLERR